MSNVRDGGIGEHSPFLTEAGTLLNAAEAIVDPRKLVEYSLNPNHPVGGHKARVLARVLGFNQTNAQLLRDQVLRGIRTAPARPRRVDEHGSHFRVDLMIRGPNGAESLVRTGWVYRRGESVPRLTTVFIP